MSLVGVAWVAGCEKSSEQQQSSPTTDVRDHVDDNLVDIDPDQPSEPNDSVASGGAAGGPLIEAPDVELPGVVGTPRGVSDFDAEAREPTPRAEDARGLGGACQSTSDCRAGFGCADVVFSGVNQSYIAGGYCSRWCEEDADCASLEPGAYCAPQYFGSDLSFCAKPCLTGEAGGASKCGGRPDVSCGVLRAPGVEALCVPRCTADTDCSRGHCSSSTGLCEVGLPPLALPVGAPCSARSSCNGFCAASSAGSEQGVCSGYCRLGSTCGEGPGSVCSSEHFGLRDGDGGTCEQACTTSEDCTPVYTACAPTGFVGPGGEPRKGCARVYAEPESLAPQRLSVEQLALAFLPASVINVSTTSIFQALSHRLAVEAGAVCVTGNVIGEFGALLELNFQLRPNNGSPLVASGLSAFSFDAEGPHVVRFDVYTTPGRFYRYLLDPNTAGDVAEGPQRLGTDQLFDIFAGDTPFAALEAPELEALSFSLVLDDGPGPFRFCVKNLALEGVGSDPLLP